MPSTSQECSVTYKALGANWFSVSGYVTSGEEKGRVYYQHTIVSGGGAYTFLITYEPSVRDDYDPLMGALVEHHKVLQKTPSGPRTADTAAWWNWERPLRQALSVLPQYVIYRRQRHQPNSLGTPQPAPKHIFGDTQRTIRRSTVYPLRRGARSRSPKACRSASPISDGPDVPDMSAGSSRALTGTQRRTTAPHLRDREGLDAMLAPRAHAKSSVACFCVRWRGCAVIVR